MKKRFLFICLIATNVVARIQEINPDIITAAGQGDKAKVKELLAQGVPIDIKGHNEKTALIVASQLGKTDIVQLLLKHGANPNIAITGEESYCTEPDSPEEPMMCADVTPGTKAPYTIHKGWTALHFAADNGHNKVAVLLLKKGKASVDSEDALGRTPLMIAAKKGDALMVKLFLRFGANVNKKSFTKRSALYYAVASVDKTGDGGIRTIKELKNNGAVVDDEIMRVAERRKDRERITKLLTDSLRNRPLKNLVGG